MKNSFRQQVKADWLELFLMPKRWMWKGGLMALMGVALIGWVSNAFSRNMCVRMAALSLAAELPQTKRVSCVNCPPELDLPSIFPNTQAIATTNVPSPIKGDTILTIGASSHWMPFFNRIDYSAINSSGQGAEGYFWYLNVFSKVLWNGAHSECLLLTTEDIFANRNRDVSPMAPSGNWP